MIEDSFVDDDFPHADPLHNDAGKQNIPARDGIIRRTARYVGGGIANTRRYFAEAHNDPANSALGRLARHPIVHSNPAGWALLKTHEHAIAFHTETKIDGSHVDAVLKHPHDYGLSEKFAAFHLRTHHNERLTAWYHPPAPGFPTIVYCHGNTGMLSERKTVFDSVTKRGYGLIAAPYPGFTGSRQSYFTIPTMDKCLRAGHTMAAKLHQMGTRYEDMIFMGESIGNGVATHVAYDLEHGGKHTSNHYVPPQKLGGVIGLSCYTSFPNIINEPGNLRYFPPSLLDTQFAPIKKIPHLKAPVLLLHGKEDTLIGIEHARKIKAAAPDKVELIEVEKAGHVFFLSGETELNPAVIDSIIAKADDFLQRKGTWPALAQAAQQRHQEQAENIHDAPLSSHQETIHMRTGEPKTIQIKRLQAQESWAQERNTNARAR